MSSNLDRTSFGKILSMWEEVSLTLYLAGLERDVPLAYHNDESFTSKNRTIANAAWNSLELGTGMVALPDEYADSQGLLNAQRFPWDNSKGVYFLNGFHALHCLVGAPATSHGGVD